MVCLQERQRIVYLGAGAAWPEGQSGHVSRLTSLHAGESGQHDGPLGLGAPDRGEYSARAGPGNGRLLSGGHVCDQCGRGDDRQLLL